MCDDPRKILVYIDRMSMEGNLDAIHVRNGSVIKETYVTGLKLAMGPDIERINLRS